MQVRGLSFVLVISLCVAGEAIGEEGAYNKGVAAYNAKNYAEARSHWAKSIEEGERLAVSNLAYLLYYGLGGTAEPERAVSLWKQGALAGHSEAQWHLGRAFAAGKVVERDYVEAYAWYRCALASTESPQEHRREVEASIAKSVRDSIEWLIRRMSPEQIAAGDLLAMQYIATHARGHLGRP